MASRTRTCTALSTACNVLDLLVPERSLLTAVRSLHGVDDHHFRETGRVVSGEPRMREGAVGTGVVAVVLHKVHLPWRYSLVDGRHAEDAPPLLHFEARKLVERIRATPRKRVSCRKDTEGCTEAA